MLVLLTHEQLGVALAKAEGHSNEVYLYRYSAASNQCWSYNQRSLSSLLYLDASICDLSTWTTAQNCTRQYFNCDSLEQFFQEYPELLI